MKEIKDLKMAGGRLSEEEKKSKLIALKKAFGDLKEQSTIKKNLATFSRVRELANEKWEEKGWTSAASEASLKSKSDKSFCKEVRDDILAFKEDRKQLKSAAGQKIVCDIAKQQSTIDTLVIRITELLHNEIKLKEDIVTKEKTIKRLKEEISSSSDKKFEQ